VFLWVSKTITILENAFHFELILVFLLYLDFLVLVLEPGGVISRSSLQSPRSITSSTISLQSWFSKYLSNFLHLYRSIHFPGAMFSRHEQNHLH
jgi:hypothetical protein